MNVNAFTALPTQDRTTVRSGVIHAFASTSTQQESQQLVQSMFPIISAGQTQVGNCFVARVSSAFRCVAGSLGVVCSVLAFCSSALQHDLNRPVDRRLTHNFNEQPDCVNPETVRQSEIPSNSRMNHVGDPGMWN